MALGLKRLSLIWRLKRQGIADPRVLAAIQRVPRVRFVPERYRSQAYKDRALPIAKGQTISQPYVVAFMTEALRVDANARVLEIGTGSGYQTAVLALLAGHVYTIERHGSLAANAQTLLDDLGYTNITFRVGDGLSGWPEHAPFDRILATAAATDVPDAWLDQLAPDGVLVAPVGTDDEHQSVVRISRQNGGLSHERLLPVRFVAMLPGVRS